MFTGRRVGNLVPFSGVEERKDTQRDCPPPFSPDPEKEKKALKLDSTSIMTSALCGIFKAPVFV